MRVVLASGYPRGRRFLRAMVEDEPGAVVIGQAENTPGTLALARSLRPDVVIIDSHLPHAVALEAVPLSQIGGLDAAQAAMQEIPNARVVLLNTDSIPREGVMSADFVPLFSRETGDAGSFTLQELISEPVSPQPLVFASVRIAPSHTLRNRLNSFSDKAMLGGVVAILLGLIFIVTLFLAVPGIFIAIAGAVSFLFGGITRMAGRLWWRLR